MATDARRLARYAARFRGRTIGVLGDFMLDELLRGEATRISPEAPVPVVRMNHPDSREGYAGGAGNVAANIASLGGRAVPFGAIGADPSGRKLLALLREQKIPTETLVQEPGRVTPRKVRVVAHQHQLLRLDFEPPHAHPLSERSEEKLLQSLSRRLPKLQALVISDYRKGTVTTRLAQQATTLARQRRIPVFVDPKPDHPEICRHATVVTPNLHEARQLAGLPPRATAGISFDGERLRRELACDYLLVTRGPEGMVLFTPDGNAHEIPGESRPVYDVTGAGDTVVAVLALACAAGAPMLEAARLANAAGGQVVLKFGTGKLSPGELLRAL